MEKMDREARTLRSLTPHREAVPRDDLNSPSSGSVPQEMGTIPTGRSPRTVTHPLDQSTDGEIGIDCAAVVQECHPPTTKTGIPDFTKRTFFGSK